MSRKRKNPSDEQFQFTFVHPMNPGPEAATSSLSRGAPRPPHPQPEGQGSAQKRPRLDPSTANAAGTSKPTRKFSTRLTAKQKTEAILDFFADSNRYGLGDFLQYIFSPKPDISQPAANSLSYWLQGTTRVGTRPAEIVDMIYRHEDGLRREGNQLCRPSFSDLTPPTHPPWVANQ
ncbi:hypothetical protein FRC08_004653 [Ceratobasidium sp. 394]|nr:hypothetical protein FRC08_004653 [Ceratobasidium sp. 394]